ncbi:MAG TPA: EAL domain-containing protein [Burkholderiales bacterium]|nr:EAL domain-containing protein [Burkholderiales bacterium]
MTRDNDLSSGPEHDRFLDEMDDALTGWKDPAQRLRDALAGDELQLYIQPIARLGESRFVMAEVLVRLREEETKMLPPGEFLPVFEQYGMMPDLDCWVVSKLVQRIARHAPGGFRHFSINVAGKTLLDSRFPEYVSQTLRRFGVPAQALCFEIDEIDVLGRLDAAAQFGAAMRGLGCQVAIDGFGRRSASFAPLKSLRVDYIKVDGSITRNILSSDIALNKLRAIVRVAQTIKVGVIAEFVEETDVLVRLHTLGVGYAQGFGIARPTPIDELRDQ